MNRFTLYPCVVQKGKEEDDYSGPLAALASLTSEQIVLFFPISEENASLVNFLLKDENRKKININQDIVGVYKTMIESWKSGDRHISGIILDARFNVELQEEVIDASIILIDVNGNLDSVVKTNMVHAIVVAAIEEIELYVSNELFEKLNPGEPQDPFEKALNEGEEDDDGDDDDDDDGKKPPKPLPSSGLSKLSEKQFPNDANLIKIVRQIMSGKNNENKS